MSLNLDKGSVTFNNIYNKVDYNVSVHSGNVTFNTVNTESVINLDVNSGDIIIENLLEKSNGILAYPEMVNDNEDFSCCRKKFRMKQISIGDDAYGEV